MQRFTIVLGLGLMLVGCADESGSQQPSKPMSTSAAPAPKSASNLYFETVKDGRTYVFGNVATMQKVSRGDNVAGLVVKDNFGPAGETVVFESDGQGLENRLMEDYAKQHPAMKK